MDHSDDKLAHGTCDKKRASKIPRGYEFMHREASRKTHSTNGVNIESRVTYNAVWTCEQFVPSRMPQWAVYSITKHWFQSVRTCPYSWAAGRNTTRFS